MRIMEKLLSEVSFRKSPRMKNYDYSSANYYFITICTHEKKCIFYNNGVLNANGITAKVCMQEIADHFCCVRVDKFVIMPNHVHAIIVIEREGEANISSVVGQYKAAVSKRIHEELSNTTVWQRSFHDHIIRNQASYERIWSYIDTNPQLWSKDCFYTEQ